MRIAAYISGHGFGHLAQCAPVLNRLHQLRPECRFLIRCALPETEIRARLAFDFELQSEPVDTGVVQHNAIEEGREESIRLMRHWIETLDQRIEREAGLLNRFSPSLVLSNISPLAFPTAKLLGVPSIALASLDWHAIYRHWLEATDPVLAALKTAYGQCDLLLSPPMSMEMDAFPKRRSVPLIAATPAAIDCPVKPSPVQRALVMFGGASVPPYDLQALAEMGDWQFLIPGAVGELPGNVQTIHLGSGIRAVDLMPHVDAVVCKPSYGMLAECWRTGTPIAWVERCAFPEFPMLKRWLDEQFPSCGMRVKEFRAGRWQQALEGAVHSQRCFPKLKGDGADVVAEALIHQLYSDGSEPILG